MKIQHSTSATEEVAGELVRVLEVLNNYKTPAIAWYIKFVMHTGIRRSAAIAYHIYWYIMFLLYHPHCGLQS